MKLVEQIYSAEFKKDFRTRYIRYRAGRLKHQYWLWNRKNTAKKIDSYDARILRNCQPGATAFFCSAGYYINDIWPDIDSIEMHDIVPEFCPHVIMVESRRQLASLPYRYDNFAVVNNRGDHWVDVAGLTQHLTHYCAALNPGARVFYSFRDTQIHYNRLKIDGPGYFLQWAQSLTGLGLSMVWHDLQFPKKMPDQNGDYDLLENPDTVNGNIKFWFVYQGVPWSILT